MGETDGDQPDEERPSVEPESTPAPQDTLQLPKKRRQIKSPTPGSIRGRSMTPIHGRSRTPFDLYLTRRSGTPTTYRSITPFLKRDDKEKTPFELGTDIHTQLISNYAVFDKACYMDITEPEEPPIRYITSDMSVIDRAAVMDVSNVEVIYVVEEYDDEELPEEEEEVVVEVKPKKKAARTKKAVKGKKADREGSEEGDGAGEDAEREGSADLEDEAPKKGKKKAAPKKKEKSPSPKISLNLEMGGGQKGNKKMFEQAARPPPKKSALAIKMEEQAKAAAKAAEEEAARIAKSKDSAEEKRRRMEEEAAEQARLEEEQRLAEEEENQEYGGEDGGEEGDEYGGGDDYNEDAKAEEEEEEDIAPPTPVRKDSDEGFTRPDDSQAWDKIANIEGQEFMMQMRRWSAMKNAEIKSEKERDADWQKHREQFRRPCFINYLSDRACEVGHNVRLVCAVFGNDLSVKWFKDGKQIERDSSHRILNNNNILSLEILNCVPNNSGEYKVIIANMTDEVQSTCIVTVYEVYKDEPCPPIFSLIKGNEELV